MRRKHPFVPVTGGTVCRGGEEPGGELPEEPGDAPKPDPSDTFPCSVAGVFIFCNTEMTTRCGFLDRLFGPSQPLSAGDAELKSLAGVDKAALCCERGKRGRCMLAVPIAARRAPASRRTASWWPAWAQAGSLLATVSALQPAAS